jgi:chemotaxis protein MotB
MSDDATGSAEEKRNPSWRPPARSSWAPTLIAALAMGAAGAAGYYSLTTRSKLTAATAELAKTQGELEADRSKLGTCDKELEMHKSSRADTQKKVETMQADVSSKGAELEELRKQRAEAEQRLAAWKSITEKLQKMIDSGKLKVQIRDGKMIVKLSNEILFESGKADLATDGKTSLREVATILRQFADRRFMIAGHTDNLPVGKGNYKNNWELSTARAVTVTEFLVASGLRPQNLVAAGYGQYDPIAPNGTEAGRKENRRMELILLPNIAELPGVPAEPAAVPAAAPAKP